MILVDITAHAGKPRPCLGGGQVRCQVRIGGFDCHYYYYHEYYYYYWESAQAGARHPAASPAVLGCWLGPRPRPMSGRGRSSPSSQRGRGGIGFKEAGFSCSKVAIVPGLRDHLPRRGERSLLRESFPVRVVPRLLREEASKEGVLSLFKVFVVFVPDAVAHLSKAPWACRPVRD